MPEHFRTPIDPEIRRLMGLDKESVSEERIVAAFPSEDLRRAVSSINAETMPRKSAIESKKRTATEIRERNLIDQTVLMDNPTVYVGSGIDVEYPLVLGARKIELVDPIFQDPRAVSDLIQRITNLTSKAPNQVSSTELEFSFDFGEGDEVVTVAASPTLYAKPGADRAFDENKSSIPIYETPDKIGMILGFRTTGVDIDADQKAVANLVPGGYLLSDHATHSFITSAQELKGEGIFYDENEDVKQLLKDVWAQKGFEFIPLENEEDSYHYTFARKL